MRERKRERERERKRERLKEREKKKERKREIEKERERKRKRNRGKETEDNKETVKERKREKKKVEEKKGEKKKGEKKKGEKKKGEREREMPPCSPTPSTSVAPFASKFDYKYRFIICIFKTNSISQLDLLTLVVHDILLHKGLKLQSLLATQNRVFPWHLHVPINSSSQPPRLKYVNCCVLYDFYTSPGMYIDASCNRSMYGYNVYPDFNYDNISCFL